MVASATHNAFFLDAAKDEDYFLFLHPNTPAARLMKPTMSSGRFRSVGPTWCCVHEENGRPVQQEGRRRCLQDRGTGNPNQVPTNRAPGSDAGRSVQTSAPRSRPARAYPRADRRPRLPARPSSATAESKASKIPPCDYGAGGTRHGHSHFQVRPNTRAGRQH